ncbi:MAG TPA: hypothetical protein ENK04_02515 [Gammaproteobacteria bacterium]|nr:hypothetical protein [Gammaproteobacteria bacterium]
MTDFAIKENLYIYPTPAGAYYAVSSPTDDPAKRLLRALFQFMETPNLSFDDLHLYTGIKDRDEIAALLKRMQSLDWLQGCEEPQSVPPGDFEEILPELLSPLSNRGHVLLADNLGFHISYNGFNYETVEQLSALSADISSLHERHIGLLENNLGLNSSAWAIVDAAGNSQVGFWPLYIGKQRFVLVIGGLPRMNQPILISLIWALNIRFAKEN